MNEPLTYPMSKVTPDKTAMEFCCTTVAPVVRYLQDKLGEQGAREIVYRSDMNWEYLQDRQHWVSFEYFCRLLELGIEATGDPRMPYNAAVQFTDASSMSFLALCLLRSMSVKQAYSSVAHWGGFWSKIHKASILDSGDGYIVFRNVYPYHTQIKANCLAVQGALAILPTYWGGEKAEIEEMECCCEGDASCTYRIHWQEPAKGRYLHVSLLLGILGGSAIVAFWGLSLESVAAAVGLTTMSGLVGLCWHNRHVIAKLRRDNQVQSESLLDAVQRMEELNRTLQETIEERTHELSKTNEELEETLRKLHLSQAKMVEQERDAAIGVLAAGMAHELNSPINAIRLSVQALLEDMSEDDPDRVLLAASERATSRCRRMVNDLLCFARDKRVSLVGDLREAVYQAVETFTEEIQDACPVGVSVADDVPAMTVDKAQIQQALSNLLINAHDAMEGRGEIHISLDPGENHSLRLTVADTGPGMTEEKKKRIFEPFFSTKQDGRGLGIGLAISRRLFERNGAAVAVETAPGTGTQFVLTFHSEDNEMLSIGVEEHGQRNV